MSKRTDYQNKLATAAFRYENLKRDNMANKGCNTLRGNLSEMAYEGYNQDQLIYVYMRYCYDVGHVSRAKPVNVIDIISQASQ
tara:strand:+ start:72 stop:320 length:249 start_codon:yes stop_codon:yes gene_type:complete